MVDPIACLHLIALLILASVSIQIRFYAYSSLLTSVIFVFGKGGWCKCQGKASRPEFLSNSLLIRIGVALIFFMDPTGVIFLKIVAIVYPEPVEGLGSQAVFHRIGWQFTLSLSNMFTCLPRFSGEPVEGRSLSLSKGTLILQVTLLSFFLNSQVIICLRSLFDGCGMAHELFFPARLCFTP